MACAISTIIGSYRKGELSKPLDHNHVLKWVSQFDEADRSVILEETLHILTRQYYSREAIENLVDGILCKIREQVGSFESIIFANPQEQGSSQKILYTIISEKLGEEFRGQSADFTEPDKIYVYIDDGLYTGGRARTDLVALIELLPPNSRLYVFYLFAYSNACSYREDQITELAKNKKIEICFDWGRMFYNERSCKAKSIDFVWPTILARKDEEVLAYEAKLKETQKANYLYYNNYVYQKEKGMFSSYDAEERVGYAFLKYGIKICNQLNKSTFRPLGLTTPPSFGFGSLVATDYNISPREYTFLRRRGSLEDLRQAEQTAQNIITLSLLNRGITLKRISPATLFREDFPRVRPSLGLDLKCEIGERRWLFFYVLAECAEDGERSVSPLTSSAEHMAYNALTMRSSLFLLDAWYPEKLDDTRSTIVFRDAKLFDAAVELLRRRPIQTAMSVMLLDFDEGRIVKEQWISQGLEKSARFQSSSAPVPTSAPDSVPSLVPCSSPIGHLSIIFSASFNKSSRSSEVNVLYSTSSLAGRRISQPPA